MKQITGHTGLTGLFGSPVAHSISPMMHNASFEHLGLDYVYLAFDVGTDKLAAAVDGLRAMNVRGFNLTMPDKNKMCELCDRLSPAAEIFFFFKQKTAYEVVDCDWSSDVCSSDLIMWKFIRNYQLPNHGIKLSQLFFCANSKFYN